MRRSLGFRMIAFGSLSGALLWYNFGIERSQTNYLLPCFLICFLVYLYAAFQDEGESRKQWFWIGILSRVILFTSLPILSDDYFRFIWDGRLLNAGVNPFENLPESYLNKGIPGITRDLFNNLNSPEYFTIYPPVNQLVFWLSVKIFPQSIFGAVTIMRLFIFAADIGNYFLLKRISKLRGLPERTALIYFLNPLVLLEFTGNLHFESVMIFFILLSIWLLVSKKEKVSALSLAMSISSKLLPIMYLPSLLKYLTFRKAIVYYLIVGTVVIISFIPLVSPEFIQGLSSSLDLYFRKFEFNASFYFMARELGYLITGYNQIAVIGPLMGLLTIASILGFLWMTREKEIPWEMALLFIHLFYLLFATTVHPWYITTLVALTVLTRYRFAIIWSGLIFLTYVGYHKDGFSLPSWVLYVEYGLLGLVIFLEVVKKEKIPFLTLSQKNSRSTKISNVA